MRVGDGLPETIVSHPEHRKSYFAKLLSEPLKEHLMKSLQTMGWKVAFGMPQQVVDVATQSSRNT